MGVDSSRGSLMIAMRVDSSRGSLIAVRIDSMVPPHGSLMIAMRVDSSRGSSSWFSDDRKKFSGLI